MTHEADVEPVLNLTGHVAVTLGERGQELRVVALREDPGLYDIAFFESPPPSAA